MPELTLPITLAINITNVYCNYQLSLGHYFCTFIFITTHTPPSSSVGDHIKPQQLFDAKRTDTRTKTQKTIFLHFFVNRILVQSPAASREFYHIMYVQFYCRMPPYLVGIACAEIYMKTNDKVHNLKATWWKVGDGFQINH